MIKTEGLKLEDGFIVNQIRSGNTQSFKILVMRYQKPIFRYLGSFGLRPSLIEEIAQETFLRAFKNLSNFDEAQANFSTWIHVIAKNLTLNEISRHSSKNEEFPDALPEIMDPENPLSLLEQQQLIQNLHQAIDKLPIQFRNALTLFHLNELNLEEIAHIEGCSLGTVKSRIFRGKELLKSFIIEKSEEL
ncbi:MAG: RNA polymerase sigma factor [Pseudobdellovibrionaceae bacterium]